MPGTELKTVAVYAGSFDPFTMGHLEIVERARDLFDEIVILIGVHPDKKRVFPIDEMKKAIAATIERQGWNWPEKSIFVETTTGLVADFCDMWDGEEKACTLVRGLRDGVDFGYEEQLAKVNEKLGVETVYFRAAELGYVSSTMVRQLFFNGRPVQDFVPKEVLQVMQQHQ